MIWAMGALVVILLLLVAIGNLRLMMGFLASVIVVIGLLLVFDVFEDRRSASRIPVGDIELQGFNMAVSRASIFELKGRVQNHSPDYGLFRLGLRVLALDCTEVQSTRDSCTVIGDQVEQIAVDIPAGQARDVDKRIRIADAPFTPKGILRWEFEVVATGGG